jgi:hypothetical protein
MYMGVMKRKRGKRVVFFLLGVLLVAGGISAWLVRPQRLLLTKKDAYFIPLKIHGFDSGNIPYLDMKIESRIVTMKIDLGFEGAVSLPAGVIKELHLKDHIRRCSSYALSGKTYTSDVYRVKEVAIENMTFFPVPIEEANSELDDDIQLRVKDKNPNNDQGTIGWRLFQRFNLLVDCKHSMVALCDGLETLEERGYPVSAFVVTPLLLDRGLIEFEAKTKLGALRCVLDSGSTLNMLNKDLENASSDHHLFTSQNTDQYPLLNPENDNLLLTFGFEKVCEMPVFSIGGKEFGPVTFNQIRSPMAIEAIIGMEFFEDTLIFIDFAERKIYFFEYPIENVS